MRPFLLAACLVPLAAAANANAQDKEALFGTWLTERGNAKVAIDPCEGSPQEVCGSIVWLSRMKDDQGRPFTDRRNQDEALRGRPIMGLPLLSGFKKDGAAWSGGRIYNPEDGKTYRSNLTLKDADTLLVEGCVLVFCREQTWKRAEAG